MSRFVFSDAARADRREITAFTVERFGVEQARRLRIRFEDVLNSLAESPLVGHTKPEIDPPGRRFRYFTVLSFIVVYEPTDSGIRVARLLHGARSLAEELNRDAGDE